MRPEPMGQEDWRPRIEAVFPGLASAPFSLLENRLIRLAQARASHEEHLFSALSLELFQDLLKVLLFSEFVAEYLIVNPLMIESVAQQNQAPQGLSSFSQRLEDFLCGHASLDVKKAMLEYKRRENAKIAWQDLTGKADLATTLEDLSDLAQACLTKALDCLFDKACRTHGTPLDRDGNPQKMMVLGMGKLGARELNFSSDLDLIFVFSQSGTTQKEDSGTGISHEQFYTRLCREFVRFFSADQGMNFFRIDTRLRPFGDSGPIVMNAAEFEEYYQLHGREWERYAMIKARPVAGDIEAGKRLLANLNSFVFRRYFDYNSFDSFRDMKSRIASQVTSRHLQRNIKLGPGGIREIEFFVQLFQMIRGGVEPDLQEKKVIKCLQLLCVFDCIRKTTSVELCRAYTFLRRLENRLQAYQDRQTHDIPDQEDLHLITALSMGYNTIKDFQQELSAARSAVHRHFSQLLVTEKKESDEAETAVFKNAWLGINDAQSFNKETCLADLQDGPQILSLLQSLASHPNTRRLTKNGHKKLTSLVPQLLQRVCQHGDGPAILGQLIDLVITIERRTCYLSLLVENQAVLDTLIVLARKSPWIIGFVSRHPAVLDELLHPDTLYSPPDRQSLEKEMAQRMAKNQDNDPEFLLEELNMFCQVNILRVAAADVSGNFPLMEVSNHLSWIAQIILQQIFSIAWNIMVKKYGVPQGADAQDIAKSGFLIIAYGKLGGLELGYKSDLDLVFLCTDTPGKTQGTSHSIDNIRFYSNLGQRIVNLLTLSTESGFLYKADMRLRPGGSSGMLVSPVETLEDYLHNQAWTWEHQALIRARPVAGDQELERKFQKIRASVLCKSRQEDLLRQEVKDMREKIRREKYRPDPDAFDLKQGAGGIVDIEFLVQYLILKYACEYPELAVWTDNIRLLESLELEGLISADQSQMLQKAYVTMRRQLHRLTLLDKTSLVGKEELVWDCDAVKKLYNTIFI